MVDNLGRKIKGKQNTLFFPPKSKKFAEIISIESPNKAKKSVVELEKEFKKAKFHNSKVKIKNRTVLVANRVEATLKRKNLSDKERTEFKQILRIYRQSIKRMRL